MTISIEAIFENNVIAPEHSTPESAGVDFKALETKTIRPSTTEFFKTGIRVAIPQGFYLALYNRSGLSCKKNIVLANCTGVIDSDYRGEILIALYNRSICHPYIVKEGDKIAQGVLQKYYKIKFLSVDELVETKRGEGGFNSTGD